MFDIKDNTIHLAVNSNEKIDLFFKGIGKDEVETGYVTSFDDVILFQSDRGENKVSLSLLIPSLKGWNWHNRFKERKEN
jgi:hypothetical protein